MHGDDDGWHTYTVYGMARAPTNSSQGKHNAGLFYAESRDVRARMEAASSKVLRRSSDCTNT